MKILILRTSVNSNSITGELYIDDKYICQTLELLDRGNMPEISSIPEGSYGGSLRYDHKDHWRIELTGTEPRTNVQIHIGNSPKDIRGCILVGEKIDTEKNEILNSAAAYLSLKYAFYGTTEPNSTPLKDIRIDIKKSLGPVPKGIIKPSEDVLDADSTMEKIDALEKLFKQHEEGSKLHRDEINNLQDNSKFLLNQISVSSDGVLNSLATSGNTNHDYSKPMPARSFQS